MNKSLTGFACLDIKALKYIKVKQIKEQQKDEETDT